MEYVNPLTGLCIDGRRPTEMRHLKGEVGSALFEMGNTRVIAAVYGPREIQNKGQQTNNNEALVRCEYSMANFSTGDRARRPKGDRLTYLSKYFKLMVEQDQLVLMLQRWHLLMREYQCVTLSPLVVQDIFVLHLYLYYIDPSIIPLPMDAKLSLDTFETVMQLAVEGCKAIAQYIREIMLQNMTQLESRRGS